MEKDLISVIIPMYNMEKFIAACLESVCAQSYKNLEIICVNDGSPDRSVEIAETYAAKDSRIKIVHNEKNMGLFRTRVHGMKVAKGKYIAHVDADDTIAVDWFRLLHKKAVEENADMTIGNIVCVDEHKRHYYFNNFRSLTKSHKTIRGEAVLNKFFEQAGSCFAWHVVWDKLYTRELVDKCLPYFEKVDYHLIMCEDIAFSSIYYTHAQSLAFADVDAYFYFRHSASSTSNTAPKEKIIKNILDVGRVFEYVKNCLQSYDKKLFEKHSDSFDKFKARFHRFWCGSVDITGLKDDEDAKAALQKSFGDLEFETPNQRDSYFFELTTDWSFRLERIKKLILDDEHKVITFDVFDTLVQRPLYKPEDIHEFVGKFAQKIMPEISANHYVEMRLNSQNVAYQNLGKSQTGKQDIQFEDIFDNMSKIYDIPKETTKKFADEEIRLEKHFCLPRKQGIELFELAKAAGKQVVIISDMFLPVKVIKEILAKNGVAGYDKFYLSSNIGLLKAGKGDLFDYVVKALGVEAKECLHIGDNWQVDILNSRKQGMDSEMIPKAIETFENVISDIYTGWSTEFYKNKYNDSLDGKSLISQLPFRSMIATVATNSFDNPYNPFQKISKFNGDAYYSGYATMGMHMMGVAKWMLDIVRNGGYKKVVFLARDGFVIKPIFESLCEALGEKVETDYFYATRKALACYMIKTPRDLYFVNDFMKYDCHTPNDYLEMFKEILKPTDEKLFEKHEIVLDEKFKKKNDFNKFIKIVIEKLYGKQKHENLFKTASAAFKKVFDSKTLCFDIGYSGRLQNAISDLAGTPIDVCFIHSNGDKTRNSIPFKVYSFLDYTPAMSSIVREFLISDPSPSCERYDFKNGKVVPIFDSNVYEFEERYPILEYQKGAINFCKDFVSSFKDYIDDFVFRPTDCSMFFDYYMANCSEFDRYTFTSTHVDDFVFSGYENLSLYQIWTNRVNEIHWNNKNRYGVAHDSYANHGSIIEFLEDKSKFKRAIFWLLFDRKKFKEKFKKNLKRNKK